VWFSNDSDANAGTDVQSELWYSASRDTRSGKTHRHDARFEEDHELPGPYSASHSVHDGKVQDQVSAG
jgi:hypothetical protein